MRLDAAGELAGTSHDRDAVLAGIAGRAVQADRGDTDLSEDISALMRAGLLSRLTEDCLPGGSASRAVALLRAIGRANLSVGRLVEGHVNARVLIHLYGTADQRERATAPDQLHAVWAADGDMPVRIDARGHRHAQLSGQKIFCSGLGLVRRAVVTAQTEDAAPQMVLVDVTDPGRAHPEDWCVSGMRATRSGRYDLTGVRAALLGQPGDYMIEPHFDGGIWRYLALHVGGLEALAEETRQQLGERAARPLQAARLVELAIAAQGARLWVEDAAQAASSAREADAVRSAVPRLLLARQAVETACQQGIALAERALGTAAFMRGGRIDLIRRDLAFFLRQADLDGKTLRTARALMRSGMVLGDS
ncbi:MAG: acyl-CoA dehydrogenase [Rhodobacterales bacterium]|nr:acyl-CoA dehydrogenase [Rhodobacterales bacterium]MDX5414042.1 acyl-CoA dehydrogenase [Rhodobacterales bacterium]